MPVGASSCLRLVDSESANIGGNDITFKTCIKYLGVRIYQTLSMHDQISSVCRASSLELRRISSIRRYLSRDATAGLVTSMITSRLDYCNSALSGLTAEQLSRLQRVQRSAARLVFNKKKPDHITSLLKEFHWLPVEFSDVSTRWLFWLSDILTGRFLGIFPLFLVPTKRHVHSVHQAKSC